MKRLVVKFGGTSVGSAKAIGQAADIVRDLRAEGHHIAVVTSAMSGVTDALLGGASAATSGHPDKVRGFAQTVRAKHEQALHELQLSADEHTNVKAPIDTRLDEFALLCDALGVLGEASPRALDAVGSLGERMSVHLLAAAIRARGLDSRPIDAASVVRTDATFQAAVPVMDVTARAADVVVPLMDPAARAVVTGFIGAVRVSDHARTRRQRPQRDPRRGDQGRRGLDFTDVDGVMTADPRVVQGVRTLDTLSYREMSSLRKLGAKVLHPKTVYLRSNWASRSGFGTR